jgi:hypothetical protein
LYVLIFFPRPWPVKGAAAQLYLCNHQVYECPAISDSAIITQLRADYILSLEKSDSNKVRIRALVSAAVRMDYKVLP